MLHNAGYIARPVTSAIQAVAAIEALTPNLILMDISMPDIDGYVFCNMLKKSANTRDIPVIFVSALRSDESKIKGLRMGAVDFIVKPFNPEEVMLRINTHLKMYKIQLELEAYNKKLYKIINDQVRKNYEEQKNVIYALGKLIVKLNSSKTAYFELVGKNSRILAMSLQVSSKYQDNITNSFIDAIELASPLLDIGTFAINDVILKKPASLIKEEKDIKKSHTTFGANTLEEIYSLNEHNDFLKMAIDIARFHHENWDGSGYPMGLKGTEIPLCARIVSVVDAYNLIVVDNVCQNVYTYDRGMEIMNEGSGVLFDPDIIAVLNKIHNQLKK
jgi:putative two-component system response regulator